MILMARDPSSAHWSEQQYRELFETTAAGIVRLVLVAEVDTKNGQAAEQWDGRAGQERIPRGFLVARYVAPEWELENIVVASSARRNGTGSRLLTALIEVARDTNSEAVFLDVRESNSAARALYEKFGFQEFGRRKSYYDDPLEDAILFRLDVR